MAAEPSAFQLRVAGRRLADLVERRLGLTVTGAALIPAAIAGWLLGYLIGSRTMFLLTYGVIMVLVISRLLALRRPTIEAIRSDLPLRVRQAQEVAVTVSLSSKRRASNLIVEDVVDPLLGRTSSVAVPQLNPGQPIEFSYSFRPRARGVYEVGPLVATWSDPFGLTRGRIDLAEKVSIIVHPSIESVRDRVISRAWEDPPIRPPVSKPWPTGFEFYGMRDYVPGDDPRRINWRATARTMDPVSGAGRYLVRVAEQGITDRVMLVLDTDRRRHSPGTPSDTFEAAVRTAASLGVRHLTDGMSVTVESNSASLVGGLRTRGAQIQLLDALARVRPESEPLVTVLQRIMRHPRRDTHVVLVTPHIDDEAAARIGLLKRSGFSLLVGFVVWEETDPSSIHRVGSLGCNVVEIAPRDALGTVFQRVVEAGARKQ